MTTYLVNPSHVAFGIGVITPRWLYVLASATPPEYGTPVLVEETPQQVLQKLKAAKSLFGTAKG